MSFLAKPTICNSVISPIPNSPQPYTYYLIFARYLCVSVRNPFLIPMHHIRFGKDPVGNPPVVFYFADAHQRAAFFFQILHFSIEYRPDAIDLFQITVKQPFHLTPPLIVKFNLKGDIKILGYPAHALAVLGCSFILWNAFQKPAGTAIIGLGLQ